MDTFQRALEELESMLKSDGVGTPVLSDAMDEVGVCGAIPGVRSYVNAQRPVVGYALPAQFRKAPDVTSAYRFGGGVGRPLERVLKSMRAGQVVVLDLGGTVTASA